MRLSKIESNKIKLSYNLMNETINYVFLIYIVIDPKTVFLVNFNSSKFLRQHF